MLYYAKIWLASARYSITRTLMFRGDFFVWSLVELFWMSVNLFTISVIYDHTDSIAGWSKYQMVLLVGTSLLIQRFLMGFFWSSIFEMGRNIRSGNFDFYLAQPGNVMFMATTRKLDPDSLVNSVLAAAVVIYAARQLGLDPGVGQIALYGFMVLCGVVIGLATITGIRIRGVPTYRNAQIQSVDGMNLTYTWVMDGMKFCFLGRQPKPFDADQLTQIGAVDILFLPMDTLGGESRNAVLAQLRPKAVIPMGSVGGWSHGDTRGVQGSTVTFSRQMLPARPVTLVFNR